MCTVHEMKHFNDDKNLYVLSNKPYDNLIVLVLIVNHWCYSDTNLKLPE